MTLRGEGPKFIDQAGGQKRFKYAISDLDAYLREQKPKTIAEIVEKHS